MRKLKAMTFYKAVTRNECDLEEYYSNLGIVHNFDYLCLGEITNMPNHYAFVGAGGKVVNGLHAELFKEVDEI